MSWDDWSVLSAPDAELDAATRAAIDALGPGAREALSQRLGTIVNQQLEKTIAPWFSRGTHDWAAVDVFAAELRDDMLVLHFLADHYNYNYAQSGSDWVDHYFFVGRARLRDGKHVDETFAPERDIHLTEHEDESYSPCEVRAALLAELRARFRGESTGTASFDREVAAVRAASIERGHAARKAHEAQRAAKAAADAAVATPTPRCPSCKSRDVAYEPVFDNYSLTCRSCGHSKMFERYPEPDSDADWYE